jgi:FkbM family methyltransferase
MEEYYKNISIPDSITNVKLDIGLSYNAPQSQVWLNNDLHTIVFGFEPNPDSVKSILSKNITKREPSHGEPIHQNYINTRFFLFPICLSNVETQTTKTFYSTTEDCGTSSLYKPTNLSYNETTVPVYSLQHFFDVFPWSRFEYIDYIKIDAQGSDLDILKSAGDYLKDRVVYITAEPESVAYENCSHNNTDEITNYLLSQNFQRIDHPNAQDPTYINNKFIALKDEIFIYQKG